MHAVLHHMTLHLWMWVAALAALGAAGFFFKLTTPGVVLFLFVGLLIMVKSEGSSLEHIVEDDPLEPEGFADPAQAPQ